MIDEDLIKILGEDNILDNPEVLSEYSGKNGFKPARLPSLVLRPANIEELKGIVNLANTKKIPLVPVSSGIPHLRGDSTPSVENAVIVDLRRMNKIIRIDPANRVAIVEPGVTFGNLQGELAKTGMSAYLPLSPRKNKSVLASVLERDPITMPGVHFDSTDPMLCAEIVFGTGDSMRTGEAAGPDTLEQQWEIGKAQISPFGPTQMDPQRLVSGAQGTIGILTWMSLKCRFLSEKSSAFLIPNNSLGPLIDLTYKLTRIRFTGNIFILDALNLACLLKNTPEEIKTSIKKLAPWQMFVSCEGYGILPEEKIRYLEADLMDMALKCSVKPERESGGINAVDVASRLAVPSSEPYWKQRLSGSFKELFFLTTLEKTPEFTKIMDQILMNNSYPRSNMGVYIQPVAQGTSCHCEFDLFYNPENQTEIDVTRRVIAEAADKMETMGAFFSRPYPEWSDIAYRRSPDTAEMQKKIKAIFDPNFILNPGRLCFK